MKWKLEEIIVNNCINLDDLLNKEEKVCEYFAYADTTKVNPACLPVFLSS